MQDSENNSEAPNAGSEQSVQFKRRLTVILCADVAGYSLQVSQNELRTLNSFNRYLREVITPRVSARDGRIFKMTGDGFFAEFGSALDAVQCSMEMQKGVQKLNTDIPEDRQLRFRMGLTLSEVHVLGDGDLFGEGVIVAERLQSIADAEGIVISEELCKQLSGKSGISYDDLGCVSLKNIREPVRVFKVNWLASEGGEQITDWHRPPIALPVLAVLPFNSLGEDDSQKYFADGITNDLITDLSRFSNLGVIASHSVFQFRKDAVDVTKIAGALKVRYVVEGSVQRAGDNIRINAQLIDAKTGVHLWSQRYRRQLASVFDLQDELVKGIASAVATRVELNEMEHVLRKPTHSLLAYDHYLRGKQIWGDWSLTSNSQAQRHFITAASIDPAFSRAYSSLSYMKIQAALGGWAADPFGELEVARDLAEKAYATNAADFEVCGQLAMASLYCRDFDRCLTLYRRALELNASSADLLADMADAMVHLGRVEEGVALIADAVKLNPFCPDWYHWVRGIAAFAEERYEDALTIFLALKDLSNFLRADVVSTYARIGLLDQAKKVASDILRVQPNYRVEIEKLRPFKDLAVQQRLMEDLLKAGLPL